MTLEEFRGAFIFVAADISLRLHIREAAS
jgi:hypothetical protein